MIRLFVDVSVGGHAVTGLASQNKPKCRVITVQDEWFAHLDGQLEGRRERMRAGQAVLAIERRLDVCQERERQGAGVWSMLRGELLDASLLRMELERMYSRIDFGEESEARIGCLSCRCTGASGIL